MKFFIQVLIVFALTSAGISPACNFINGNGENGWIQICTSDGTIKKVSIDINQAPFYQEQNQDETTHKSAALDDCAFCLSHANGKTLMTHGALVSNPLQHSYLKISGGMFAPKSLKALNYQPRAPPVFS